MRKAARLALVALIGAVVGLLAGFFLLVTVEHFWNGTVGETWLVTLVTAIVGSLAACLQFALTKESKEKSALMVVAKAIPPLFVFPAFVLLMVVPVLVAVLNSGAQWETKKLVTGALTVLAVAAMAIPRLYTGDAKRKLAKLAEDHERDLVQIKREAQVKMHAASLKFAATVIAAKDLNAAQEAARKYATGV